MPRAPRAAPPLVDIHAERRSNWARSVAMQRRRRFSRRRGRTFPRGLRATRAVGTTATSTGGASVDRRLRFRSPYAAREIRGGTSGRRQRRSKASRMCARPGFACRHRREPTSRCGGQVRVNRPHRKVDGRRTRDGAAARSRARRTRVERDGDWSTRHAAEDERIGLLHVEASAAALEADEQGRVGCAAMSEPARGLPPPSRKASPTS